MKKGFTLVELLILAAILTVLAAILVPSYMEARIRSNLSRAGADMRSLATAIEAYKVDNKYYPTLVAPTSPLARTGAGPINGPSVLEPGVSEAISSRFVWITTPVAYISSVMRDSFIDPSKKFALSPTGDLISYLDTYNYIDAYTLTPLGRLGGTRGAAFTSGAQWHIVSSGPDKKDCYGGGAANYHGYMIESYGCDYDPTNGIISAGDIVRVGGGSGPLFTLLPSYDRILNKKNTPHGSP
ncbi:prepilin-type N-terminal cleavage/methylation domain-containing protein, partial [Candidatus Sumerlaeota bacterium]|nr:prepilin-type N-terminal cleavage/methylation domain-containing protein [Candidatus Sumerlaeota bacterium]